MSGQVSRSEIVALVYSAVVEVSGTPLEDIREESRLFQDLGLESIDIVDIFFEIEKRLPRRANLFQALQDHRKTHRLDISVGDLVRFIEERA